MGVYKIAESVENMLREGGIYADVWPYDGDDGIPAVVVKIDWGDWKHEHARAKWLCIGHGGKIVGSTVTEEDGSDCYSAEHYILFVDGYKEVLDEASDF